MCGSLHQALTPVSYSFAHVEKDVGLLLAYSAAFCKSMAWRL